MSEFTTEMLTEVADPHAERHVVGECRFCTKLFRGDVTELTVQQMVDYGSCALCLVKILEGANKETRGVYCIVNNGAILIDYCACCGKDVPNLSKRPDLRHNYMYPRYKHAEVCGLCSARRVDALAAKPRSGSGEFTRTQLLFADIEEMKTRWVVCSVC